MKDYSIITFSDEPAEHLCLKQSMHRDIRYLIGDEMLDGY